MRLVIPSLRYADFLAVVLPAWWALLPREVMTVVTAPEDEASQTVARRFGVACVVTDAWTRKGARLNKARALDEAFGLVPGARPAPTAGEICVSVDADVVPFGQFPLSSAIAADAIYGCARYHCPTPALFRAHLMGDVRRRDLSVLAPATGRKAPAIPLVPHSPENVARAAAACLGYFQLFRWQPGLTFGDSKTAGTYDLTFRNHFARRLPLERFYVLHLGEQDRRNWQGRVVPAWKEA